MLVSASRVSLDVRLNSTVIQFIQTSPPLEGYYSHFNSLLLFFPLYTSSTSFKTYCKNSVAGNPNVYSSSNGIKVYYFLLIQSSPKNAPSWWPVLLQYVMLGCKLILPSVSPVPFIPIQLQEERFSNSQLAWV